ncbi:MAG TPA: thioredoxin domain-containing protein [Pyrinomonadaceae bacterium]|jgi:protein-disulfide isomerase|nr:thioredoxin domain-containing protein [Pyrinomonadaceae bacterium]
MKKFLSLALILASASLPANAQTRRRTTPATTPATQTKPAPATAAQPTPTPVSSVAATVDSCACEGEPLPEVVAVVNGVRITKQEIDAQTRKQIDELQKNVVEARQRELDLQINSRLLEAEAKKRGVPTSKLLETEIVAKVPEPTGAEAQTFYNANQSRIDKPFADVQAEIISYLRDQRQREEAKRFADKLRTAANVKILVPNAAPPRTDAERARVIAVVNGEQLTAGQIEESLKPLVYNVQERAYQLRKNQVELRINDALLTQEAQKRKITTTALLLAEVDAKAKPVTEAEARAFYDQNKERVNGDFPQLKDQIVQYLQEAQKRELQAAFAEQLRRSATLEVNLRAPEAPVLKIATDDQPSKGVPAAPVTIVEFTDFQCPSCAQAHPVLERLTAEYGDRLRLVVRDYPLEMHENAPKAAEAAEAARAQGKYWEYAALLFANQNALGVDKLKVYATQVGLDRAKFDAMLDSGQFADKVQRDYQDGTLLGVGGTPTFFVNGRLTNDRTYEGLKAAIEKALAEKGKK